MTTTATATTDATLNNNDNSNARLKRHNIGALEGRRRPLVVRLHLVRHGETEANRENLVLGQRESPLTEKGLNQARALGKFINSRQSSSSSTTSFWRVYSSDYERTRITAYTILNAGTTSTSSSSGAPASDNNIKNNNNGETTTAATTTTATCGSRSSSSAIITVRPDERLRERAKGVREGRPKSLSYKEALALYHAEKKQEQENQNNNNNMDDTTTTNNGSESEKKLPLLESDDDVWNRVKSWIDTVVLDAYVEDDENIVDCDNDDYSHDNKKEAEESDANIGNNPQNPFQSPTQTEKDKKVADIRNVLAVSHSATIRTTLNRLVGNQLPSDVSTKPVGEDGTSTGMLIVPNTSRTIVDIIVEEAKRARLASLSDDDDDDDETAVKKESKGGGCGETTNSHDKITTAKTIAAETPNWYAKLVDLTNTDHLQEN